MIKEPQSSLLKQYTKQFQLDGLTFELTDEAAREIASRANKRGTGARGLRSLMEELLLEAMYEAPDARGCRVILDHDGSSLSCLLASACAAAPRAVLTRGARRRCERLRCACGARGGAAAVARAQGRRRAALSCGVRPLRRGLHARLVH